jgi:hypothetical protein
MILRAIIIGALVGLGLGVCGVSVVDDTGLFMLLDISLIISFNAVYDSIFTSE